MNAFVLKSTYDDLKNVNNDHIKKHCIFSQFQPNQPPFIKHIFFDKNDIVLLKPPIFNKTKIYS